MEGQLKTRGIIEIMPNIPLSALRGANAMNESRKKLIERLADLVSRGDVLVGGKLPPERELAEMLGTSRPALREAEIALEALGILDIRDRQGVYLAQDDADRMNIALGQAKVWPMDVLSQVMEIRQLLDPPAAAIAAVRRSDRDMARLERCIDELESVERTGGPEKADLGAYWNVALHGTIVAAARNALLSRMYETLLDMTKTGISAMRMDVLDSSRPEKTTETLEQHRAIVAAIAQGDSGEARRASEIHLQRTIEVLVDMGRVAPASNFFTAGAEVASRRD